MVGALINQLLQGVLLGGLYTLFATGLSFSAGVMRFVNIAHGDFIVLACFALLTMTTTLGLHPVVALVLLLPVAFAVGFTLQRFLLQRVVGEKILLVILVTFGLSIIIQNGLLEVYGADTHKVAGGWMETSTIALGPSVNVGLFSVLTFIAAVIVVASLDLLLYRSGIGVKIRAVSEDVATADLIGLSSARIYGVAMGISFVTIGIAAGFHVDMEQFRSLDRPDAPTHRLRSHRSWRTGQHVGIARWWRHPWPRSDDRRPIRCRLADHGWPYRLLGGSCGAAQWPLPQKLRGARDDRDATGTPQCAATGARWRRDGARGRTFFLSDTQLSVLADFFSMLVLAILWNLLAGYADIVTIGQHAFVGVGAYAFYAFAALAEVDPYLSIPLAGVVALIIAVPTMALLFRLRTAYFSIGTWVVAEVMMLGAGKIEAFGGGSGISVPIEILRAFGSNLQRAPGNYLLA